MIQNCAIGAMRNAVIGAAADSNACGEAEDAPLRAERHDLLDDGLLGCLDGRDERHVEPDAERVEPPPLPDREERAEDAHHDDEEQHRADRVAAEPELRDERCRR